MKRKYVFIIASSAQTARKERKLPKLENRVKTGFELGKQNTWD